MISLLVVALAGLQARQAPRLPQIRR